jgi:hypothetical protein
MSTTYKGVNLGGTASHVKIGGIGYGLMMMTWTTNPTPDEQAFEAIKTAIAQVPEGYKLFLNSGRSPFLRQILQTLDCYSRRILWHQSTNGKLGVARSVFCQVSRAS